MMKLIKSDNFSPSPLKTSRNRLAAVFLLSLSFSMNLILGSNAFASSGDTIQSLESITQAAKNFLEEKQPSADNPNVTITISAIDRRLRLAKCDSALQTFFPQRANLRGNTTVGVKCLGPVTWKIFVPVKIEHFEKVWVTKRNLSTGDIISLSDLAEKTISSVNMRKKPLLDLKNILSASPKRFIRAGSVIFNGSVCLVCKGDKVNILAQNKLISIQVEGIAMHDAIMGETAQIKNTKSKRVFSAQVIGKSQLKVSLASSR